MLSNSSPLAAALGAFLPNTSPSPHITVSVSRRRGWPPRLASGTVHLCLLVQILTRSAPGGVLLNPVYVGACVRTPSGTHCVGVAPVAMGGSDYLIILGSSSSFEHCSFRRGSSLRGRQSHASIMIRSPRCLLLCLLRRRQPASTRTTTLHPVHIFYCDFTMNPRH